MRQEIHTGATNYYFVLTAVSWMPTFGKSLFVLADSNRFEFTTDLHFFNTGSGREFLFKADESSIRSIAASSNVEVRVIGISGHPSDWKLTDQNRKNFRDFAEKYLPVNGVASIK